MSRLNKKLQQLILRSSGGMESALGEVVFTLVQILPHTFRKIEN